MLDLDVGIRFVRERNSVAEYIAAIVSTIALEIRAETSTANGEISIIRMWLRTLLDIGYLH